MPKINDSVTDCSHYRLRCVHCGADYPANPFRLQCDQPHAPSLLRTVYRTQQLTIRPHLPGIFRFLDWLPADHFLAGGGKPITYQSTHLARRLGLEQLYISFNGYWPERAANLLTGSFKELEAPSVLARVPEHHRRTLVVASAGNTGRAFAHICSSLARSLYLVIPEKNLDAIWSTSKFYPGVRLIVVSDGGDYADAIALAQQIGQLDGFFPEGGAANVARRDGMGLTVLDAVTTLGQIPAHYFQAVGSGTGGISAWEANQRLLQDGRFGNQTMQLHLAQNSPFSPMVDAWKRGSRTLVARREGVTKAQINQVSAKVLTNRSPAYAIAGGVYDALTQTGGQMYAVTNSAAVRARRLFKELEGIDISPSAGIATAALLQAAEANALKKTDCILLNITSGGTERIRQDYALHYLAPRMAFSPQEIRSGSALRHIEQQLLSV
ncbi:cysteate synthase [Romeria aff. gracilis LEGE 07310]|uniref:Cysteate synthase n=1 Tax=Vasconcelosia minhoensis LEGE 07310 TaxID=915328 RepID=A0A8J7DNM9_9CYAN|nr:cysteate synthase [Romeria aff. gracilis LEGE 07310]